MVWQTLVSGAYLQMSTAPKSITSSKSKGSAADRAHTVSLFNIFSYLDETQLAQLALVLRSSYSALLVYDCLTYDYTVIYILNR
jgi:hypothetical protein